MAHSDLAEFCRRLPKAELHVHLEGSAPPESFGLPPFQGSGFLGFLQTFKSVVECLRTPADYAALTRGLLARLMAQNVGYAEITLSAGVVLWKKQDLAAVYEAVRAAAAEFPGIETLWILDAIRHFGAEPAMEAARFAASRASDGVIAFGIGGDEARGPAEWFTEVFAYAKAAGLRVTAHAGEAAGPESVWAALRAGAERIGHGIRAIEDPTLIEHLAAKSIALEVCITSNVATGVVASLEQHPVRRLFDAGVPIVLNTDDPGIFGCTLSGEYELAARAFGMTAEDLRQLADNSYAYRFGV